MGQEDLKSCVDINGDIDDDDSAPSSDTDDESEKADMLKLKPKKLSYEGQEYQLLSQLLHLPRVLTQSQRRN